MGAVIAVPFALVAIPILGKWKDNVESIRPNSRLVMPVFEWAWKLVALLWVAIALPVMRMMKTALAVGLLFAVLMNSRLLLPTPYMPEPVRMAHLMETALSNSIFGFLVGRLLTEHLSSG
jgi:hypothetical protein